MLGGSETRSRVKNTPSATLSWAANAVRARAGPWHSIFSVLRAGLSSFFSLVRYLSKRYERSRAPKARSAAICAGLMVQPSTASTATAAAARPLPPRAA